MFTLILCLLQILLSCTQNKNEDTFMAKSKWNTGTLLVLEEKTEETLQASLAEGSATQEAFIEYEGKNYNTLYGNFETGDTPFKGYQVSTKTVGQLTDFSKASGAYGQYVKPRLGKSTYAYKNGLTSTPMGRYQIIGATLRDTVKRMGLPTNTIFSKDVQDEMFLFLAREKIEMGKTPRAKRQNLRGLWEGFKKVPDAELDAVIAEIGT